MGDLRNHGIGAEYPETQGLALPLDFWEHGSRDGIFQLQLSNELYAVLLVRGVKHCQTSFNNQIGKKSDPSGRALSKFTGNRVLLRVY
jgi:hypothetical protein